MVPLINDIYLSIKNIYIKLFWLFSHKKHGQLAPPVQFFQLIVLLFTVSFQLFFMLLAEESEAEERIDLA